MQKRRTEVTVPVSKTQVSASFFMQLRGLVSERSFAGVRMLKRAGSPTSKVWSLSLTYADASEERYVVIDEEDGFDAAFTAYLSTGKIPAHVACVEQLTASERYARRFWEDGFEMESRDSISSENELAVALP